METTDEYREAFQFFLATNPARWSAACEKYDSIRAATSSPNGGKSPESSESRSSDRTTCNCCSFLNAIATLQAAKAIAAAISDLSSSVKALSPEKADDPARCAAWEKILKDLPTTYGSFRR